MQQPSDISTACLERKLPVNLLLREGLPLIRELKRLGARRRSAGSGIAEFL
ncbi:hypothetical protein RA263_24190 [Pseudomonas syringae pv. tagetis]|uniref:Uncharacterized protein n=1 Tax=Pseudomonas syringae pv. tagetis TaxID=129140 RepID=A0ABW7NTF2_9PSED|nr:hypothetical protein [Pseudomonas syringae group genomosp. 7]UNB61689.1 hypothetical protein MME54_18815 [Pseudomonas syringae pv. helianthi]UNB70098.1 hypothetical protein MME58_07700 [Pseudomonas syringae pv. tagetis]